MDDVLIALDYDGVIADTNLVKSNWILDNIGINVSPSKCDRSSCAGIIGLENYEQMSNYVYEREASLSAKPVANAIESIKQLSMYYEFIIITARTNTRVKWAIEWLEKNKIVNIFRDIVSSHGESKVKIAKLIGARILVDDDIRHLIEEQENYIKKYHFSSDTTNDISGNIEIVGNWKYLVEKLESF